MFVDYTDDQKALRREFRAYFSQLIKPEYREELRNAESGDLYKQLIRQQGKDGMLAVGWPEEYGGRGLTESEQLIRYEEALLAGAPTPFVTLNTVGPSIISRGTEEQKKQIQQATGKDASAIEVSVEELEERVSPRATKLR